VLGVVGEQHAPPEKGDLDAIVALLHDEHRFRTALVDANGRTGTGFYRLDDGGEGAFFALHVLEAKDGRIRIIDHFTSASSLAAFFAGGLARTLAATTE
jgi:hypothetical protein